MNLIESWKESLRFFERENLKSFLLVSFKAYIDVFRVINKPLTASGNLIAIGVIVLLVLLTNVIKLFHLFVVEAIVLNSMHHVLFFLFCLAMRPSIGIKDVAYFRSYLTRFWILFLLALAIIFGVSRIYVVPLTFIWYIFSILFAFDSSGGLLDIVYALKNGFMMVLYNVPICAALWVALAAINVLLYYLVGFALGSFGGLTMTATLYLFFVPVEVAFITNLYIKFVHSQSSLYFSQPKQ